MINIENGTCIGYISDVEVDICNGKIIRLFVQDNDKLFRVRKNDCIVVFWENIAVIGADTILVKNVCVNKEKNNSSKPFLNLFSK